METSTLEQPVLTTRVRDWETMKHQFLDYVHHNITTHNNGGFSVVDRVGIYSSLGHINCTGVFTTDNRGYILQFSVHPKAICPGSLVIGKCETPYSYSDVSREFSHAVLQILRATQPTYHTWSLKTVVAEPVQLGKYYAMRLLFERYQ